MDILVNVANQKLKIATNLKSLVAGTQEFVKFTFNLTDDWDGLLTFAQFCQNDTAYNQYLDEDNSVYLPPEIGAGTCTLMLYGSGDDVIATTNYLTLTIDENVLVEDANSTEISTSLYNQLVTMFGAFQDEVDDLSAKFTAIENSETFTHLVESTVQSEMTDFLANGYLANLTIEDGSITRSKVNSAFEATLSKADSAMQPSVYDTNGVGADIFQYVQNAVNSVANNVSTNATNISGNTSAINALRTLVGSLQNVTFNNINYSSNKSIVDLLKALIDAAGTQLSYDNGQLYLLNHNNDELGSGITVAAQGGGLSGVKIEVLTGDALAELGVEDELSDESYYVVIEDDENNEVLSYAFLPATGGSSGGGSSTNIVITYDNQQSSYIYALGTPIRLGGSYSATDSAGDSVVCSYVWKVNGTTVMQGSSMESISSFNFTDYCTAASTYKITLTLSDGEGAIASKSWSVQTVDLKIESGFDDSILYQAGQNVRFTYTPYGAVQKTAHFILDGDELTSVSLTSRQNGGSPREYILSGLTHGAHLLECYITAEIGSVTIETAHIQKNIVCYDINTSSPIITSLYQTDYVESVSVRQYNQLNIGFTVYDPTTNTPTVTMTDTYTVSVADEFGNVTEETRTDDSYEVQMLAGEASGVIHYKTQYIGEHTLTLSCRTA